MGKGIASGAKQGTQAVQAIKFEVGSLLGILSGFGLVGGLIKFVAGATSAGQWASPKTVALRSVETVFGDASKGVEANADKMAASFGLPKKAMLDASASIGLVGKASGQTKAEAAAMSVSMANLAADASSFYNVPLEEAMEKIRSGLVGEAEPMRAFGVLA